VVGAGVMGAEVVLVGAEALGLVSLPHPVRSRDAARGRDSSVAAVRFTGLPGSQGCQGHGVARPRRSQLHGVSHGHTNRARGWRRSEVPGQPLERGIPRHDPHRKYAGPLTWSMTHSTGGRTQGSDPGRAGCHPRSVRGCQRTPDGPHQPSRCCLASGSKRPPSRRHGGRRGGRETDTPRLCRDPAAVLCPGLDRRKIPTYSSYTDVTRPHVVPRTLRLIPRSSTT